MISTLALRLTTGAYPRVELTNQEARNIMTSEERLQLGYRLALLESSLYRYRSRRLRSLSACRAAVIDRAEKEIHQAITQVDGDYHNLAKEVRALRKHLGNLDSPLPDESGFGVIAHLLI